MKKHGSTAARAGRKVRRPQGQKSDKTAVANARMKTTNKAVKKLERDFYVTPDDLRIPFSF